ncbi:MAG: hypothetical protein V3Q69_12005 [Burkholderia sp.]
MEQRCLIEKACLNNRIGYNVVCPLAGVMKLVNIADLNDLSARSETSGAEPFKFGETPGAPRDEATPSQARTLRER